MSLCQLQDTQHACLQQSLEMWDEQHYVDVQCMTMLKCINRPGPDAWQSVYHHLSRL